MDEWRGPSRLLPVNLPGGSRNAEPLAGLQDRPHVRMRSTGDLRVRTVRGSPNFELNDGRGPKPSALLQGQVRPAYSGVPRQLTPTVQADRASVVRPPVGGRPGLLMAAGPAHLDGAIATCPPLGCFSLAHRHSVFTRG